MGKEVESEEKEKQGFLQGSSSLSSTCKISFEGETTLDLAMANGTSIYLHISCFSCSLILLNFHETLIDLYCYFDLEIADLVT